MSTIVSKLTSCYSTLLIFQEKHHTKKANYRLHRIHRKRLSNQAKEKARLRKLKTEMEIKNFKLYMKNQSISEENEKLRKKAALLHLENIALQSQLQNVLPTQHKSY